MPLTDTDGDGAFTADFSYLTPAGYRLSLKLPDGIAGVTTEPTTPETVTVVSGQEATATLTVTGAVAS